MKRASLPRIICFSTLCRLYLYGAVFGTGFGTLSASTPAVFPDRPETEDRYAAPYPESTHPIRSDLLLCTEFRSVTTRPSGSVPCPEATPPESFPSISTPASPPEKSTARPSANDTEALSPDPQRLVIAFYNTENFFDTLPSPGLSNDPYTPTGSYRWNHDRYFRKVQHIARVLDSLKADLIGLAEIENESVLRDLVSCLHTSYNYLIRPGDDPRGIQVALLYRGSQFFPLRTFQINGPGLSRPVLGVQGRLQTDTITLLIAHLPSLLNRTSWRQAAAQTLQDYLRKLTARHPRTKILLMGDMNMTPGSALARKTLAIRPWPSNPPDRTTDSLQRGPLPLFTPFAALERRGIGSYAYRDRRYLYDYISLNAAWFDSSGWRFEGDYGIFAPDLLIHPTGPKRGYPIRTFDRGSYLGGFSDHLPVWLIIEK